MMYCRVTLYAQAAAREGALELALEELPAMLAAHSDSAAATAAAAVAVVAAVVAALQRAAADKRAVGASAEGLGNVYEDSADVAPDVLIDAELAGVSACMLWYWFDCAM
jgi:hypothetical protein